MRTNGNTFPRFIIGQDDIGLIINSILPELDFPVFKPKEETKQYIIGKKLTSYIMFPNEIIELKETKSWNIDGREK